MGCPRLMTVAVLVIILAASPAFAKNGGGHGQHHNQGHGLSTPLKILSYSIVPSAISPNGDGVDDSTDISVLFKARPLGGSPNGKHIERRYYIDYALKIREKNGPRVRTIEGQIEVEPGNDKCKIQNFRWCHKNGRKFKKLVKCIFKSLGAWKKGIEVQCVEQWDGRDDSDTIVPEGAYIARISAEFIRETIITVRKNKPPTVLRKILATVRKRLGKIDVIGGQTPLEISLTSPAAGSILASRNVQVEGTVSDPLATVSVNGVAATISGNTFSATVPFAVDGQQTITAVAELNGQTASDSRQVVVDTVAPQITISQPTENQWFNSSTVIVAGTIVDENLDTVTVNGVNATVAGNSFTATISIGTEGANTITVVATDGASNQSQQTVTVQRDTIAPQLTITTPIDGLITNSGTVTVEGTITEANLVSVVVNGQNATVSGNTFTATVNLSEGQNVISATGQDLAGNESSANVYVIRDSTPPVVAITSPTDGTYTSATAISVTGQVTENNLTSVTVNGIAASVSGSTFTALVPLSTEGDNQLIATVLDAAGNSSTAQVTVVRDTTNPQVTISSPVNNTLTNATTITVTGQVNEANLSSVEVNGVTATLTGTNFTVSVPLLTEGDNTLTVIATDLATNQGQSAVIVQRDTVAPIVANVSPAASTWLNSATVVISGTVSDDHLSDVTVNGVTANVTGSNFTATITLANQGANSVDIVATDSATNSTTYTHSLNLDTVQPLLSITSPSNDFFTNGSTVTVVGQFTETNIDTITVNGISATVSGSSFTADIPVSTEGEISISAMATDLAGNYQTAQRTITRDTTLPVVANISPAANTWFNSSSVTITGTVTDLNLQELTVGGTTATVTGSTFSATVNLASEGANAVDIVATDKATNATTVSHLLNLDTIAPVVAITDPAEGSFTNQPTITVTGQLTEANVSSVDINGVPATISGNSFTANVPLPTEGTNTLVVTATDLANNSDSAQVAIQKDTAPPVVTITSPTNGFFTSDSTVTVTGQINEANLDTVTVNGIAATVSGNIFTVDLPLSTEGDVTISALAKDKANNEGSAQIVVVRDVTSPVITMTSPALDTFTKETTVVVTGQVTEINLDTVFVNGIAATVTGGTYSATVPLSVEGVNTLTVLAADKASNTATFERTITRDTIAPTIAGLTPMASSWLQTTNVTIAGTVTDQNLASVTVGGTLATVTGSTFSATVTLTEGPNNTEIVATDRAGNSFTVNHPLNVDVAAPVLTITSPADGSFTNENTITVSGQFTETNLSTITINGISATITGNTYTANVALPVEGNNSLIVTATDIAGNSGTSQVAVIRDTVLPTVTITSPTNGSFFNTNQITVTGQVSDTNLASVTVNGVTASVTGSTYTATVDLTNEGNNTITVVATDQATNQQQTLVTVVRDTTAPIATITTPTAGSFTNQISITVSGVFTEANLATLSVNGVAATVSGSTFSATVPVTNEGGNDLVVSITDLAGNSGSSQVTIIRDTTSPVTSVTSPANNSFTNQTSITVTGQISESNLNQVTANGVVATLTGNDFSASVPLNSEGINSLDVVATDFAGNTGSTQISVNRDVTEPSITITSPIAGAFTNGNSIVVSGLFTETNISSIVVNGISATISANTYSATIPLSNEGNIDVNAVATDLASNSGSQQITIVRDVTNPVLAITSPAEGSFTNASSITVSGQVTESNLASVDVNGISATVTGNSFSATVPLDNEGTNAITVLAIDLAGNSSTQTRNVTRDTTPPTLTNISPVASTWLQSTTVTITGTVTELNLTNITVGGVTATVTGSTFTATVTLNEGANSVEIVAADSAGNNATITHPLNVDTTAPVVTITSPADETHTKADTVTVSGQFTETNIASVSVNGVTATISGNTYSADIPVSAEGNNPIAVTATDLAGNSGGASISVIKDTTLPVLAITSPSNGSFTNATALTVTGQFTETNLAAIVVNGVTANISGNTFTADISIATEGSNTLLATAIDLAGNEEQAQIAVIRDTVAPVATITTPAAGTFTNGSTITVSGDLTETNLATVVVNGVTATVTGNSYSAEVPLNNEGINTLTVTVTDLASNTGTADVTVTRDTSTPVVTVLGPTDGSITKETTITVTGHVTENNLASVSVNGVLATLTGNDFTVEVPLENEGPNTIVATATDQAGNSGTGQITVSRDTTIPIVTVTSPTEGALTNQTTITVTGEVTDTNIQSVTIDGVTATITGNSFTADVPLNNEGNNTIVVTATDVASNETSTQVNVSRDTTVPIISDISPTADSWLDDTTVTVGGTVTDLHVGTVTVAGTAATITGNTFSATITLAEGTNSIDIVATDGATNSTTVSHTLNVDTTNPVVAIASPAAGEFTNASEITVTGTVTEDNIESLTVNGQSATITDQSFMATIALAAEGNITLTALATDQAGNTGNSYVVIVRDTTSPTIAITEPIDGATLTIRTVTVSGTVSDTNLATVTVIGIPVSVSAGTFTTSIELPEGPSTISAQALDHAGNSSQAQVSVNVETAGPEVTITSPVNGAILGNAQVTVTGTAIDTDLDTVTVNGQSAAVTGSDFTATITLSTDGENQISVVAKDLVGNETTETINVTLDTTPPALVITSPADGAITNEAQLLVIGTASDPRLDIVTVNGQTVAVTNGSFSTTVTLTEGANTISALARDTLGNEATVDVSVTLDSSITPPQIAITNPIAGAFLAQTQVTVSGTITGENVTSVTVNGQVATLVGSDFSATITLPAEGANTIIVQATNAVGQIGQEETTVEVDLTAPIVAITSPADGASTSSTQIEVTGTATDLHLQSVTVNGVSATIAGSSFTASASLIVGANTVSVTARDYAGNETTQTISVTVEAGGQAPQLAFTSPTLYGYVNSFNVTVTGSVIDTDIQNVVVNGVTAAINGETFTADVTLTGSEGGLAELRARATDQAGNWTEKSIWVRIDTLAPQVTITTPYDGIITTQLQLTVQGGVYDTAIKEVTVNGIQASIAGSFYTAEVTLTSGINTIEVIATDLAGNTAQTQRVVDYRPDSEMPQIAIVSPANEAVVGSRSVVVTGTIIDNDIDFVEVNDITATITGTTFTVSVPCDEGWNELTARAVDLVGNERTTSIWAVVDTYRPILTIDAPLDGSFLQDLQVPVSGYVYDIHLSEVTVNDTPAIVQDESYSATVDLVQGENEVLVRASDEAGNVSTYAVSVTVGTDPDAPRITITSPQDDALVNSDTITVTGTVSATALESVTVDGTTATLTGDAFTANVSVVEGYNGITVIARDDQGRETSKTVTIVSDTTPPSFYILSPENPFNTNRDTVTIQGTVYDEHLDVIRVDWQQTTVQTDGSFSIDVAVDYGTTNLTVTAVDGAGNESSQELVINRSDQPELTIAYPYSGSITYELVTTVTGHVIDSDLASVTVNGETATVENDTYTVVVPLVDGENLLSATATDLASNSITKSVTITVDRIAPILTISSPAEGYVTSVYSLNVTGMTTDPNDYLPPWLLVGLEHAPDEFISTFAFEGVYSDEVRLKANAENKIVVYSIDSAGNVTTASCTVLRDTRPPVVAVSSPVSEYVTNSNSIEIVGTVDDLTLDSLFVSEVPASITSGIFRATAPLSEGENTLTIVAKDQVNLETTLEHKVILDRTPPRISITSPGDRSISRLYNITVRGTYEEDRLDTITVNGTAATITATQEAFEAPVTLVDGWNTITVTATDTLGNTTSSTIDVERTDAPYVTLLSPRDNSFTNQTTINVYGTVTDDDLDTLTVNGVTIVPDGAGYSTDVNITTGPNTITVIASDLSGNVTTRTAIVTLEQTLPTITITSPSDGSASREVFTTVTGDFVEDNYYRIMVNNSLATRNGNSYSAEVSLYEGENTLRATITDKAYNEAYAEISVIRDSLPPTLIVSSPIDYEVTDATSIDVEGRTTDIRFHELTINGTVVPVSNEQFIHPVSLDFGNNVIVVEATDTVGNASTIELNVIRDPGAPILAITTPTPDLLVGNTSVLVQGTAHDANLETLTINGQIATVTDHAFSEVITLSEGPATISVIATDQTTNVTTATIQVVVDTTPPVVAVSSPSDGEVVNTSQITVSGTATDVHLASVTVNGAAATLAGASFTASITLSEGENTLSVVALDELGHQSTNELTVTLDTSGPVITVIEPANGSFTHSGQLIADATDVATKTPCTARRYSAVGSLNGKIYVIGGIDVSGQPTDLVEEYDPPTDTWSTKNNFPFAGYGIAAATVDGKLIVSGGAFISTVLKTTAHTYIYEPTSDTWTAVSDMNQGRYYHKLVAARGRLFAISGFATGVGNLASAEEYDFEQNTWIDRAPITASRTSFAAAEMNGKIFCVGGQTSAPTYTTEIYNIETNSWSAGPAHPTTVEKLTGVNLGGSLFTFTENAGVQKLDNGSLTWSTVATLPTTRTAPQAVQVHGRAHIVGGYGGSDSAPLSLGTHETFSPKVTHLTVSGTIASDSGIASLTIDGNPATISGSNFSAEIDGPEGLNVITLEGTNNLGNSSTVDHHFIVDTVPPRATIETPANGSFVGATPLAVTGRAEDIHLATATLNGQELALDSGAFSTNLGVTDGEHQLVLLASDEAGNVTSATASVTVDISPPVITFTDPTENQVTDNVTFLENASGWGKGTPMPLAVHSPAGASLNGRMYSFGGYSDSPQDLVASYNPQTDTWETHAPMPTDRYGAAAATLNGKIYVFGGFGSAGYTGALEEYDPASDTWTTRATNPEARYFPGFVALNGKLYAVGGYRYGSTSSATRVDEYSPLTDTWTQMANLPTGRRGMAVCVHNGLIYAIGGSSTTVNEVYNPSTNSWSTLTPMPAPRVYMGGKAIDGKIIIAGGYDSTYKQNCYSYDIVSDTWTELPEYFDTSLSYYSCDVIDGTLYYVGSYPDGHPGDQIVSYKPSDFFGGDAWSNRASLTYSRSSGQAAVPFGNKLFLFGGLSLPTGNETESYSPETNSWTRLADKPTAHKGYFLGAAEVDGRIYVTGGNVVNNYTSCEEYSPHTNTWRVCADMPEGRIWAATAAAGGKVYVLGDATSLSNTNMVYDPKTNNWTFRAPMFLNRRFLVAATVDGKVHAIGGRDYSNTSLYYDTHTVYDPSTDSWEYREALPHIRNAAYGFGAATIEGKIYVVGGPHSRTDGNLASVDIYDPVSDTWKDGRDILGLTNKIYNIAVVGFDRRVHVLGGNYNLAHRVYSPGALVLDVTGRADDTQLSWVTVAGRTATLSGNDYSSRILVSEGTNTVTIEAADVPGSTSSRELTFTVDTQAPFVRIDEPESGVTSEQLVTVSGAVFDDNLATLTVNGSAAAVVGETYTADIQLSLGLNTITVEATDTLGKTTTRTTTIELDYDGPIVQVATPVDGAFTNTTSYNVTGTVIDTDLISLTINGTPATLVGNDFSGTVNLSEGANLITIIATDGASNTTTRELNLTLDTLIPQVVINSPSDGATTPDSTIEVSGSAVDANLSSVIVNGIIAPVVTGQWTVNLSLTEGANTISAIATDLAGNQSVSSIKVTREIPAPQVTITSPTDDSFTRIAETAITGTVVDTDLDTVTVNGVSATVSGQNWSASLTLTEGPNLVTVVAKDLENHETTKSITINLDTVAPEITGVTPADGAVVNIGIVSLNGQANDANLDTVTINGATATLNGSTFTHDVTMSGASTEVTIVAKDKADNESTSTMTIHYDVAAPVLSNIQPTDGTWVNQTSITISGNVDDDHLDEVLVNGVTASVIGNLFSAQNVPLTTEGENTITVVANDLAGNSDTTVFKVKRDTIAPTISIKPTTGTTGLDPDPILYITFEDALSGIAEDSLTITLDGQDIKSEFNIHEGQAFRVTDLHFTEGNHTLLTTVRDAADNIATQQSTFETMDEERPVILSANATPEEFSPAPNPYVPPDKLKTVIEFEVDKPCTMNVLVPGVNGTTVYTSSMSVSEAGKHEFDWTGRTSEGKLLRPGVWPMRLQAVDSDGRLSNQYIIYIRIYF